MSKSNTESFSSTAAFIWSEADNMGGKFKQSDYIRAFLPLTVLRSLEYVLTLTGSAVLDEKKKPKGSKIPPFGVEWEKAGKAVLDEQKKDASAAD